MNDPKKAAEALKKIEEITRSITNHESSINRVEHEKNDKVRYFDQQIGREQDEVKRLKRQIDELRRQL